MSDTYVTAEQLKKTLSLEEDDSFADDDIDLAIFAASRGIDNVTNRRFWADADASQVRYYTPRSGRLVRIDDLVTMTSLATGPGDGTFTTAWTANSGYILKPLNAAADGRPWTRITAVSGRFPCAERSIKITGKFGWATVPAAVESAAGILANKLLRRARDAPFGVLNFGVDGDQIARIARIDPDVMMLIGPYVRPLAR